MTGNDRVLIRDLVVGAKLGIYTHERHGTQPVRLNIELEVVPHREPLHDAIGQVVDYESVVRRVQAIVAAGHINLVETLAERVAALCLEDARVLNARVRVEKLAAIPEAASVGVEIFRTRPEARKGA
jgi:7,8-dihydroneopterin aldolase/epimerase/oxygenase